MQCVTALIGADIVEPSYAARKPAKPAASVPAAMPDCSAERDTVSFPAFGLYRERLLNAIAGLHAPRSRFETRNVCDVCESASAVPQ
ncbi:hypothetical protein PSAB6_50192 [Paraburkholderia sabiae]|nr:hypothetical protein PSAB6_50192 [Paraburkholderia sabiae]